MYFPHMAQKKTLWGLTFAYILDQLGLLHCVDPAMEKVGVVLLALVGRLNRGYFDSAALMIVKGFFMTLLVCITVLFNVLFNDSCKFTCDSPICGSTVGGCKSIAPDYCESTLDLPTCGKLVGANPLCPSVASDILKRLGQVHWRVPF